MGLPGYPRDLPGATGKFEKKIGFFEKLFFAPFSWIFVVVVVVVVDDKTIWWVASPE